MKVAVLRPEPGNAATAARLEAHGLDVTRLPLFAVVPLPWQAPDPTGFDALLLTSANVARHAGLQIDALKTLPAIAVGAATAAATRAAGLDVALTGAGDARAAVAAARAAGFTRLLHLTGQKHVADLAVIETIPVYASTVTVPQPAAIAALAGSVALLHSPRAARRLGELLDAADVARATLTLAALSDAVAIAAGAGWHDIRTAPAPNDAALVMLAAAIAGKP